MNKEEIKIAIKQWVVEKLGWKTYPEPNESNHRIAIEFIINNLGTIYSMLLEKKLVPENREAEDAFFRSAEMQYVNTLF